MKNINWLDKLVELLVVIIGISIAFWLNSWAEDNRDKDLEIKYLESLVYDLDSDIEELEVMTDTLNYINDLNGIFVRKLSASSVNQDSAILFIFNLISIAEFQPLDNTYETLKSSGNFNLLSNFELEREITKLYNEKYNQIRFVDEIHRATIMEDLNPYVFENMQFASVSTLSNPEFMYTNFFVNRAFAVQYLLTGKISIYKESLEQAIRVRDILKEELEN